MYRQQKGITLIALVVTIIVLLILAGVTIAMLSGQNGVLTNAQKARRETAMRETEERINLTLNSLKTEIFAQQVSDKKFSGLTSDGALETAISNTISNDLGSTPATSLESYLASTTAANKSTTLTTTTDGNTTFDFTTIKSESNDGYHFYLDNVETNNTGVESANAKKGTLTIAYKDTNNNYVTVGSIVLSNTTTNVVLSAAQSSAIAND